MPASIVVHSPLVKTYIRINRQVFPSGSLTTYTYTVNQKEKTNEHRNPFFIPFIGMMKAFDPVALASDYSKSHYLRQLQNNRE